MRKNDGDERKQKLKFIVRLCTDVLLEALYFGDRRRLTKLERVGRRVHRMVENFFTKKPFLRLNLAINPGYLIINYSFKIHIFEREIQI